MARQSLRRPPRSQIGIWRTEARVVIRDWSRSALSGRYAAAGLDTDLEAAMAQVAVADPRRGQDRRLARACFLAAVPAVEVAAFDTDHRFGGRRTGQACRTTFPDAQPERTVDALLA
jgi:hypothetical protein